MRLILLISTIAVSIPPAWAADKPLPQGIQIITADQAAKCQFIDTVSAMRFAMTSASKSSRAALTAALEKAKEKGANAAVILSATVNNNQHQFTLGAYRCAEATKSD